MSYLNSKNMLNIIYTQNIDSLEMKTGLGKEKIIFAHGNVHTAHCALCRKECELSKVKECVEKGEVLYCECKGPCKMQVVLYGEGLPKEVFDNLSVLADSDMCFIMGTSLKVQPFSMFAYNLNDNCYRILVNREKVGHEGPSGFKWNDLTSNDVFVEGSTDDIVLGMLEDLGWRVILINIRMILMIMSRNMIINNS